MDNDTQAAREWLLRQANIDNAAKAAEAEINALNVRLNERATPEHPEALHTASSVVARALIARGILEVAGDWLSMETGMDQGLALRAVKSIAEELPPSLESGSFIDPSLLKDRAVH